MLPIAHWARIGLGVRGMKFFSLARLLWLVVAAALTGCFLGVVAGPGATSVEQPAPGVLIEYWNGASWTRQPVSMPDGSGSLSAVATVSATDAWALGWYGGTYGDGNGLAEHWDGASWQPVAMPAPSGTDVEVRLNSLAAISADDVWAVGGWAAAGRFNGSYGTLIEHWDGSSWAIVPSPTPGYAAQLSAVAAVSAANVWAVGSLAHSSAADISSSRTLVLHWNGQKWKQVPSPNPGHYLHPSTRLSGVAAVSPRSVWAVGTYSGRGATATLTLHWNGLKWKRVPSPNLSGGNALMAVASVGRNDVWAVGGYGGGCGCKGGGLTRKPLAEHWNGHTWRIVPARSGYPRSNDQALTSLAVVAVDDIWTVGYHQNSTDLCYHGLVEHWDGSAWTPMSSQNPDSDHFSEIAAASPAAVWAVGTSYVGC